MKQYCKWTKAAVLVHCFKVPKITYCNKLKNKQKQQQIGNLADGMGMDRQFCGDRWLCGDKYLHHFQRTWVQCPAPTGQFATISNPRL